MRWGVVVWVSLLAAAGCGLRQPGEGRPGGPYGEEELSVSSSGSGEGLAVTSKWMLLFTYPYLFPEAMDVSAFAPDDFRIVRTHSRPNSQSFVDDVVQFGIRDGAWFEDVLASFESVSGMTVRYLPDRTVIVSHVVDRGRTRSFSYWVERDGTSHELYNAMWSHNVGRPRRLADGRTQTLSTISAVTRTSDTCKNAETVWLRTRDGEAPEIRCINLGLFPGGRPYWDQSPDGTFAAGLIPSIYGELRFSGEQYTWNWQQVPEQSFLDSIWGVVPLGDGGYGTLADIKTQGGDREVGLLTMREPDGGVRITRQEQLAANDGPLTLYTLHRGFWIYGKRGRVMVFDPHRRLMVAEYPPPPAGQGPGGAYFASDGERLYHVQVVRDMETETTEVWVRHLTELDHIFETR